jgi:hypothetical protein
MRDGFGVCVQLPGDLPALDPKVVDHPDEVAVRVGEVQHLFPEEVRRQTLPDQPNVHDLAHARHLAGALPMLEDPADGVGPTGGVRPSIEPQLGRPIHIDVLAVARIQDHVEKGAGALAELSASKLAATIPPPLKPA